MLDVTNRACISGRLSASANKTSNKMDIIIAEAESLPNIKGYFLSRPNQTTGRSGVVDGADGSLFRYRVNGEPGGGASSGSFSATQNNQDRIEFNAGAYAAAYRDGGRVNPNTMVLCYWRRFQ